MTERDERALREALRGLEATDPVDPAAARRGAAERRRHRQALAGIVTALVLVVGVVGLPTLLSGGGFESTSAGQADSGAEAAPAGGPATETGAASEGGAASEDGAEAQRVDPRTESAPDDWRTEYYRDINFQVPASWGYGMPPRSDWCAHESAEEQRADQQRPYVWLDSDVPADGIKCPALSDRLLTEHVEAISPGPAVSYAEGAVREGGWWVVTRFAGSAVLVVTTKDRARAERILDSAQVAPEDAPCPPSSPIAGPAGTRPEDSFKLSELPPVDRVVLCQYEPTAASADAELPSLRAAVRLDPKASRVLVEALSSAPDEIPCAKARVAVPPDFAVLVRIVAGGKSRQVYVNPSACGGRLTGGIDDGAKVRVLTRQACQRLLTPPIAIWSASGAVADNCLR